MTHRSRIRRAGPGDEAALLRLRIVMLEDMGLDSAEPQSWHSSALRWFAESLANQRDFAAFVADDPFAGIVSGAVGLCRRRPPGPQDPAGLTGHLLNVATEAGQRRRGLARQCVEALIQWFQIETQVSTVTLHTTTSGDGLYRQLGFAPPPHPELQLQMDRPSSGTGSRRGS